MVDAYVLIMSCEVVWFLSYYVRMYFFQVVLQLSEKKWENLQRHKKYKFENTRFEKFRLSLTKLQESFTSSGRFLSVEWTSEDLELSRICEKIIHCFFYGLAPTLASCLGRQYKLLRGQQYCIIGICIALSATAVTRKKVNSTAAALWPNQLPVRSLFWE